MTSLETESRFPNPDAVYEALVEAHRPLSEAESAAFNARLVLILANHIGDEAIFRAALALAKESR
jgi:hypothetical protein